jgi:integrase
MANSGMRKGEARMLKWRDVIPYRKHGLEWLSLRVNGKTGIRTVICQPNTNRYFDRLKSRGFNIGPDDLVFCHADGLPVDDFTGFQNALVKAGVLHDSDGNRHTIYSLRHTYATYRIENGTNIYWLAKNMGTSVNMIERHYGQTTVFQGIEYETAIRPKKANPSKTIKSQDVNDEHDTTSPSFELALIFDEGPDDLVPFNAVDHTFAIDDDE